MDGQTRLEQNMWVPCWPLEEIMRSLCTEWVHEGHPEGNSLDFEGGYRKLCGRGSAEGSYRWLQVR